MQPFLLVIHVFLAITMIALILLQHGRGADAGAAFGSGASSTVFGARGSASFLTRATAILAIVFFANSLGLAYLSANTEQDSSILDSMQSEEAALTAKPLMEQAQKEQAEQTAADSAGQGATGADMGESGTSESDNTPADLPAIDEE